jgi:hypothetical protein
MFTFLMGVFRNIASELASQVPAAFAAECYLAKSVINLFEVLARISYGLFFLGLVVSANDT